MTRSIVAVSGGISVPSSTRLLTDQILGAVQSQVAARGEAADTYVIEVRDLAAGLASTLVTGVPTADVAASVARLAAADAVVAVTPVFTASYSGLFKTYFDVVSMVDPNALARRPVLVAAAAGTARHSLVLEHAMLPLFSYLRAVVVPTGVFAATEDFGGPGGADLSTRIGRAAAELAGLAVGSATAVGGFVPTESDRTATPRVGSVSPFDPDRITPFEELLRGHSG